MTSTYDDYYSKIAPIFSKIRLDKEEEIALTGKIILNHLERDHRILDVGTGTGRYALFLIEKQFKVIGIDKSISQLTFAPSFISNVGADASEMPFGGGAFGACLMIMVLHQISPNKREKMFAEVYRVLRKGGKFIIKTCSHVDLQNRPFAKEFPSALSINLNRYPSISELSIMLDKSGLEGVGIFPTFSSQKFRSSDLLYRIGKKHNTTLALIPEYEFEAGLRQLRHSLKNINEISVPHYHSVLVVKKNE